jgi:hypothetical protein
MNLNDRVQELESEVKELKAKISDLSKNTEEGAKPPFSVIGAGKDTTLIRPIDIKTGLGQSYGNPVIWNDSDAEIPDAKHEPSLPTKGYNRHSHSRYNGGALINGVLEIVEYVWGTITNKHCPQFWQKEPKIATMKNSRNETVQKIGQLDLVFNPDALKWGTSALEIDIKKCNLVERDADGNIVNDSKGHPKSSPLYNEDQTKTSIIWDENAECWRFYAAYAQGE